MSILSIIIPSKNEKYLEKTIRNVLENAEGDIEVIAVLDGWLPDPRIEMNDDRVLFLHYPEGIGQRQGINAAVKIAKGKFIMKLDAHCAVSKGFDVILARDCEPSWTLVPIMYNLDIETFKPKLHKRTDYMYISSMSAEKPFRATYYGRRQPKNDIMIDDTMCCMGPGWFMHKERFLEQGGCDEGHGGWGQQGVEVGCKAWLSGGALKVHKGVWFAHWFRGGSYDEVFSPGFPYKMSGRAQKEARKYSQDLWLNNKWDKQTRNFQWMVDKFDPPGWVDDMTILYYTANVIPKGIEYSVLRSLKGFGYPIVSVSQEPMDLGKNIVVPKERSMNNIYKQILIGAKAAKTKYVALCEDDCLYVKEHFKRRPTKSFAYNMNRWNLHLDKEVFSYWNRIVLSQCIADREDLIKCLEANPGKTSEPGRKGDGFEYEMFNTVESNMVICHTDSSTGRRKKLIGKDDEPRQEIQPWGTVDYWVTKFKKRERGVSVKDKPTLKRQLSYVSGKPRRIQYILDNLEWFWDYRKMVRLPLYGTCLQFFKDVHEGKIFTDEELKEHPYFQYLLAGWNEPKNPKIIARCLFHMKDGIVLYRDIKKNGMRAPIEVWRDEKRDKLNIHRGLRRLAIKHALGHKNIAIRIFKNRYALEHLQGSPQGIPDNSIHGIAVKQYIKDASNGTDKFWIHNYTPHYDLHLADKRDKYKKILEIGVLRGASLLLWHDVFPQAHIYGVDKDISKARFVKHLDRVTLLQGMQGDDDFFRKEVISKGKFDLIVDDCSHKASHQKETLELLWDSVESGGMYVIEDLHWRGSTDRIAMNKLKEMIDEMNDTLKVSFISFYYNIVFIGKR